MNTPNCSVFDWKPFRICRREFDRVLDLRRKLATKARLPFFVPNRSIDEFLFRRAAKDNS
jgi:hypothetical protein